MPTPSVCVHPLPVRAVTAENADTASPAPGSSYGASDGRQPRSRWSAPERAARAASRGHLVGRRAAGPQCPACPAAGGPAGGLQRPACSAAPRWRRPGTARARTAVRTRRAAAGRQRGSGRRPGIARSSRRRGGRSREAVRGEAVAGLCPACAGLWPQLFLT